MKFLKTNTPARSKSSAASAEELTQLQSTLDTISNALRTGATAQDHAAKRMSGLQKAMGRMESTVRRAAHLEVETERLTSDLASAKAKLDKNKTWANEQESRISSLQKDRDGLRRQLETAQVDRAQLDERLRKLTNDNSARATDVATLTAELTQRTERLEDIAHGQQRLQEELTRTKTELAAQTAQSRELTNTVEALTHRLDDKSVTADAASSALRDLRMDFNQTKEKLVAANGRLHQVEFELSSQTGVYRDTMKRRDDEIIALRTQIEQLTTQLRIKDTMSTHFDEETSDLRLALESERHRAKQNEQRLRNAAQTEAEQARSMEHAKAEYEALNAKFADAVKDIEALRSINALQRSKLERFAEVNSAPAQRRDYAAGRVETPVLKAVN